MEYTTMPPVVLDWVKQFPDQTIHIHVTAEGLVSLWNRDPNLEQQSDTSGLREIAIERQRQKDVEGWTEAHDDEHANGEMAAAAACYAFMASKHDSVRDLAKAMSHPHELGNDPERRLIALRFWPWSWSWFKLKDRRRDLVRAGALIVAEIDRIDRAAQPNRKLPM